MEASATARRIAFQNLLEEFKEEPLSRGWWEYDFLIVRALQAAWNSKRSLEKRIAATRACWENIKIAGAPTLRVCDYHTGEPVKSLDERIKGQRAIVQQEHPDKNGGTAGPRFTKALSELNRLRGLQ